MRRKIAVLLALLLVGLFFTTMQATAAGKTEGGGKIDTLTFWFPGTVPRDLDPVLKETDARIQKAGIAAHLVFNFAPWSDYFDKLRALVAAGDTTRLTPERRLINSVARA